MNLKSCRNLQINSSWSRSYGVDKYGLTYIQTNQDLFLGTIYLGKSWKASHQKKKNQESDQFRINGTWETNIFKIRLSKIEGIFITKRSIPNIACLSASGFWFHFFKPVLFFLALWLRLLQLWKFHEIFVNMKRTIGSGTGKILLLKTRGIGSLDNFFGYEMQP